MAAPSILAIILLEYMKTIYRCTKTTKIIVDNNIIHKSDETQRFDESEPEVQDEFPADLFAGDKPH
jgi:hypothetical protein